MLFSLCQSRTRTPPDPPAGRCRFWIDASLETPLAFLESAGIYSARIVDYWPDQRNADTICMEEKVSPTVVPAPEYVGHLQRYTEKDCRSICLQLAQAIKIMHDSGIAHQNIHLENVLIDENVCANVVVKQCFECHLLSSVFLTSE